MLEEYLKKRKFNRTPEPKPGKISKKSRKNLIFVVQKHRTRNVHYDFRLENRGVLKSWAVPKKIPQQFNIKVLAVETENHPLEYAKFKGEIPKSEYGAGKVEIWDKGEFKIIKGAVEKGHLQFILRGDKLKGTYNLVNFKKEKDKNLWLLFKSKK